MMHALVVLVWGASSSLYTTILTRELCAFRFAKKLRAEPGIAVD
jgi:hypothetical protein